MSSTVLQFHVPLQSCGLLCVNVVVTPIHDGTRRARVKVWLEHRVQTHVRIAVCASQQPQ